MGLNDRITVRQDLPVLDQKTVGIIVSLILEVSHLALGDQLAVHGAAGTNQLFRGIANEGIGPFFTRQRCAVDLDLLRDIGGDQVIVIA